MRRNAISTAVKDDESEINLTPMLDVVFIMPVSYTHLTLPTKRIV